MDKFDKIIKESVEGYEAPYNAQAWANVSGQLGNKGGGAMKWIVGSAAVAVLLTGTVYLMNTEENLPADNLVTENTVTGENTTVKAPTVVDHPNMITENNGETEDLNNQIPDNGSTENHSGNNVNGLKTGDQTTHVADNNRNDVNQNSTNGHDNRVVIGNNNTNVSNDPEINSNIKVNSRFSSETNTACLNADFIFTPEDLNQTALYVWDFGDGTFSSSKLGSHTYKHAGTFTVSLSIKDSKTNKSLSKSSIEITVNPLPDVQFAWEKTNEMIPTVTFINLTEEAQEWTWDIKGLRSSKENQFEYTFRKKGTYIIELTASNEFNCVNSLQKPIEIKNDYNLLAPTAFTPNSDNRNDYFIPEALRIMDVFFTMVIYDKAGNIMYQTSSVNQPWDGINMNDNSIADDGAYVWTVQYKDAGGEIEYYEGQVIITR